jgi:hypothetical protein
MRIYDWTPNTRVSFVSHELDALWERQEFEAAPEIIISGLGALTVRGLFKISPLTVSNARFRLETPNGTDTNQFTFVKPHNANEFQINNNGSPCTEFIVRGNCGGATLNGDLELINSSVTQDNHAVVRAAMEEYVPIFIGGIETETFSGTTTLTAISSGPVVRTFDSGAFSSVAGSTLIPGNLSGRTVTLRFILSGNASGGAYRFSTSVGFVIVDGPLGGSYDTSGSFNLPGASTALDLIEVTIGGVSVPSDVRLFKFLISRDPLHAGDTNGGELYLLGVSIEPE